MESLISHLHIYWSRSHISGANLLISNATFVLLSTQDAHILHTTYIHDLRCTHTKYHIHSWPKMHTHHIPYSFMTPHTPIAFHKGIVHTISQNWQDRATKRAEFMEPYKWVTQTCTKYNLPYLYWNRFYH